MSGTFDNKSEERAKLYASQMQPVTGFIRKNVKEVTINGETLWVEEIYETRIEGGQRIEQTFIKYPCFDCKLYCNDPSDFYQIKGSLLCPSCATKGRVKNFIRTLFFPIIIVINFFWDEDND